MDFYTGTAEQVVGVVEAIVSFSKSTSIAEVEAFTDYTSSITENALKLACELKLLEEVGGNYQQLSPLCQYFRTPNLDVKAGVLRIILENFVPFVEFRNELQATADANIAASRIKAELVINEHREDIKQTLLNLGTFSRSLVSEDGTSYKSSEETLEHDLINIAKGIEDEAAAILTVREILGNQIADSINRNDVLVPIAQGLHFAKSSNGREAVLNAGNAIDSFLTEFANDSGSPLTGQNGINQKVDHLKNQRKISTKIQNIARYLGHIRNAADHGVDRDINAAWQISEETGLNYVFVAIEFIKSCKKFLQSSYEL